LPLLAFAAVASACSSTSPTPQTTRHDTRSTTITKPTSTSTSVAQAVVTSTTTSVVAAATTCPAVSGFVPLPGSRTMLLRAPATDHPRAAVIMIHGFTATPQGEEEVTGWTSKMAGTDVAVAYPEGSPTPYGGYGWATGAAKDATTGTDDVADINNVITQLESQDCVNPSQVLVAGESNGSGLGLITACDPRTAGRVTLYALAIPAVDANVLAKCAGAQPFPLLVMASLLDQTVPYNGGAPPGEPAFSAPLAWFEQIAQSVEGCTGLQSASVPDGTHYFYTHCKEPANFYVADDGHHTWPGGPVGAGGLSPGVFPATDLAWCASGLTGTPPPVSDCPLVLATYGYQTTG
jgi:polyhydroxybutyrate depolymerase